MNIIDKAIRTIENFTGMRVRRPGFIYVASPYSHKEAYVQWSRHRRTMEFVHKQLKSGQVVFSPIVAVHELAKEYRLPETFSFWRNYSFKMINQADELWVLQLDGWEQSEGVREEIKRATEIGIPIVYIKPDFIPN